MCIAVGVGVIRLYGLEFNRHPISSENLPPKAFHCCERLLLVAARHF